LADLINVKGLPDTARLMRGLPVKVEQNLMRGALRAGMKPIQAEAKIHAAKATGQLADGLKIGTRKKGGQVQATLKAKGPHGFIAPWIEFGTAAHRSPGPLSFGGVVLAGVTHPGTRAQPFMRPALDSQALAAVIAAGNYLKDKLASKHGLDTADIEIGEDNES
jgi:HK97 gp10 family phage protein